MTALVLLLALACATIVSASTPTAYTLAASAPYCATGSNTLVASFTPTSTSAATSVTILLPPGVIPGTTPSTATIASTAATELVVSFTATNYVSWAGKITSVSTGTFTITGSGIATTAVPANTKVVFFNGGTASATATGFSFGTIYYVVSQIATGGTTFTIAATSGGSAISGSLTLPANSNVYYAFIEGTTSTQLTALWTIATAASATAQTLTMTGCNIYTVTPVSVTSSLTAANVGSILTSADTTAFVATSNWILSAQSAYTLTSSSYVSKSTPTLTVLATTPVSAVSASIRFPVGFYPTADVVSVKVGSTPGPITSMVPTGSFVTVTQGPAATSQTCSSVSANVPVGTPVIFMNGVTANPNVPSSVSFGTVYYIATAITSGGTTFTIATTPSGTAISFGFPTVSSSIVYMILLSSTTQLTVTYTFPSQAVGSFTLSLPSSNIQTAVGALTLTAASEGCISINSDTSCLVPTNVITVTASTSGGSIASVSSILAILCFSILFIN